MFDKIQNKWKEEREKNLLTPMNEAFYGAMRDFLKTRTVRAKEEINPLIKKVLEERLNRLKYVVNDLLKLRTNKIIQMIMNKQEIKQVLYRFKREVETNIDKYVSPRVILKESEIDYLIDLIDEDDHLEEICEPCKNGDHEKCWMKRCKYRCPDSILIYCACTHNKKPKVPFNPLKFCYLRDSLDILSKLVIAKDLAYIPLDDYVKELDKLIKYFENQGILEPCSKEEEKHPMRVHNTEKFKKYMKFDLRSTIKTEVKCGYCDEIILLTPFAKVMEKPILDHYMKCKEIKEK